MSDQKIILEFERADGQSLIVERPGYHILNYEGFEAADYELVTTANINGMGAVLDKRKVLPRDLSLQFAYMGRDKVAERDRLIGFFSPLQPGWLYITYRDVRRQIQYEVVSFEYTYGAFVEPLVAVVGLQCLDPAMLDDVMESEQISTWISGWKWKFSLPFHMRLRGAPQTIIVNDGHMPVPVEIVFRGPADNPRVTNLVNGAYIQVNRSLTADDALYVNTAFGSKTVEIESGGVRTNAFNYIDLGSDFQNFQLLVGDNVLEYQTSNETVPQSVRISYRKRYLGI